MVREVSKGTTVYFGLSTDTKPVGYGTNYTAEPQNMSLFFEMNTGKIFYFNAATHAWAQIP